MATKDNFMKALKELTGFDEETGRDGEGARSENAASGDRMQKPKMQAKIHREDLSASTQEEAHAQMPAQAREQMPVNVSGVREIAPVSPFVVETPKITYDKTEQKSVSTKVTENMVVIGNIKSSDRIDILGRVRGDVETAGDIMMEGVVEGGLAGKNMLLKGSSLKGNVLAAGDVTIEAGSVIIGNVQAENIKLDGKVKGNLFVAQMTQLAANALLLGDIETTGIASSIGSRIRGSIITKQLDDMPDDIDFDVEV